MRWKLRWITPINIIALFKLNETCAEYRLITLNNVLNIEKQCNRLWFEKKLNLKLKIQKKQKTKETNRHLKP